MAKYTNHNGYDLTGYKQHSIPMNDFPGGVATVFMNENLLATTLIMRSFLINVNGEIVPVEDHCNRPDGRHIQMPHGEMKPEDVNCDIEIIKSKYEAIKEYYTKHHEKTGLWYDIGFIKTGKHSLSDDTTPVTAPILSDVGNTDYSKMPNHELRALAGKKLEQLKLDTELVGRMKEHISADKFEEHLDHLNALADEIELITSFIK